MIQTRFIDFKDNNSNIYIIIGDSYLSKKVMDKIIGNKEYINIYPKDNITSYNYMSFNYEVYHNSEDIDKDNLKKIISKESKKILLVSKDIKMGNNNIFGKDKDKLFPDNTLVVFCTFWKNELTSYVYKIFNKRNIKISYVDVDYFLDRVGSDLYTIIQQINNLNLLNKSKIIREDIDKNISITRQVNNYEIMDAIFKKNYVYALSISRYTKSSNVGEIIGYLRKNLILYMNIKGWSKYRNNESILESIKKMEDMYDIKFYINDKKLNIILEHLNEIDIIKVLKAINWVELFMMKDQDDIDSCLEYIIYKTIEILYKAD